MSNALGNYMSLFDYLGKAAGTQLGAEVWTVAYGGKVPILSKFIKTKTYKGKVNLYPLDFLEDFFQTYPHYKVKGFSPITESIPGQKNTEKIMEKKPMVVLSLSGGLDSSTLLLRCLKEYEKVICLSFDYGQKHKVELQKAKDLVHYLNWRSIEDKKFNLIMHQVIELNGLAKLLNSTLVEGGDEVPEGHYQDENMKKSVVENRNKIFSSIIQSVALSQANKLGENVDIALGIHSGDHDIYPDCRKEFRDADEYAFKIGNWNSESVNYYTPYLEGDKFTILKDGAEICEELGLDFNEVYSRTNTSYKPFPSGNSDYKSASSIERILAFIKIGIPDPVIYEDEDGPVSWEVAKQHALRVEKDFNSPQK